MKTHQLVMACCATVAVACSASDSTQAQATLSVTDCTTVRMVLILDRNRMELVPRKPKCASRGEKLAIYIFPASGNVTLRPGAVKTKGKAGNPANDGWLTASSTASGVPRIVLNVPQNASLSDYRYEISVPGLGTLDPVVKVVGQQQYNLILSTESKGLDKGFVDSLTLDALPQEPGTQDE